MSLDAPWIRWAIDWHLSPMLDGASSDEKLAWLGIVCGCKASGVRGRFRIDRRGLAASYCIPLDAVDSMVERALSGGAMRSVGERFEIDKWHLYQPVSTDRVRALRANKTGTVDDKQHSDAAQGVSETAPVFHVDLKPDRDRDRDRTENKTPHTPPQGGAASAPSRRRRIADPEPPTFAAWYAAYPKRAARPNAARAYADAMASLAARIPDESARAAFLLDRATAYAKSDIGRGDRRFVALPATWLNAARFDDDPAAWRNGNGTTHPTAPPDPAVQAAIARRRAEVKAAAEAERVRQSAYVAPQSTPADKPIHDRPKLRIAQGGS